MFRLQPKRTHKSSRSATRGDRTKGSQAAPERSPSVSSLASLCSNSSNTSSSSCPVSTGSNSSTTTLPNSSELLAHVMTLTDRIRAIGADEVVRTNHKDSKQSQSRIKAKDAEVLSHLLVQRSNALLELVEYDISVASPLNAKGVTKPQDEGNQQTDDVESVDDVNDQSDTIRAVDQALDDALQAVQLMPSISRAYVSAAQCFQCLGRFDRAGEFILKALELTPGNRHLKQMLMLVQRSQLRTDAFPRPIALQQYHRRETGPGSEEYDEIRRGLEDLFAMPLLRTLERAGHQFTHHNCATSSQLETLQQAFETTVSYLKHLIGFAQDKLFVSKRHRKYCSELLKLDWNELIVNSSHCVRKWLIKVLAPWIRDSLMDFTTSFLLSDSGKLFALISDGLLLVSRLALVIGSIRRCKRLDNSLEFVQLALDVSKQLYNYSERYEMVCTNAMGLALEEHGELSEALFLHQKSLQVSLESHDRQRQLDCHFYVGKTLMKMQQLESAQHELDQLRLQSHQTGDWFMESIARYELGEIALQLGQLPQAIEHFRVAQILRNKAGGSPLLCGPLSVNGAAPSASAAASAPHAAIEAEPAPRPSIERASLTYSSIALRATLTTSSWRHAVLPKWSTDVSSSSSSSSSSLRSSLSASSATKSPWDLLLRGTSRPTSLAPQP